MGKGHHELSGLVVAYFIKPDIIKEEIPDMDINDFLPTSDSVSVEIVHKGTLLLNEDGSPMTIDVYLPHSKVYKGVRHGQADIIISKGEERLKSEEYEELNYKFLSDITKDWNVTFGGEQPKFAKKKARELYESAPFIYDLIRKELDKQEAFI